MYRIDDNYVVFDDDFNDVLTEDILNEISKYPKIEFGWYFNQRIDNLYQGLETLKLNGFFNRPINNLPQGLNELLLGWNFNQPLDFLPQGLKELTIINPNYSHDLLNLPQGLKKIKISQNYKGQIVQLPNCEKIEI